MGKTTAGLPLASGQHYEKCPADGTVYRTRRSTRFRCPVCHTLAYAVPTPTGEPGNRRTIEGDDQGRVFRILDERPKGKPRAFGSDVVVFLEDPTAAPPAPDVKPSPPPGGPPGPATRRPSGAIASPTLSTRGSGAL